MRSSSLIALIYSMAVSNSALGYEVCTPENDYLEAMLPRFNSLVNVNKNIPLPKECIEAANLSLPVTGFYGFCPTDHGTPTRSHRRPCVSEAYVTSLWASVVNVSDCFDYDPRLAFATFNLESAMHLNAVGQATDVGVGQLTKSAIDEVNWNALDRAKRRAQSSVKGSCRRILPYILPHPSDISERCGFMSQPLNPVRNVVYSILLLEQNRKVIENLWVRRGIALPDTVDTNKLKSLLTKLAYNSGPAGLISTLKAYVDQAAQNGVLLDNVHFDFENLAIDSFVQYIAAYFPHNDPATRRRISRYIIYVFNAARRADRLSGGTLACLHPEYISPLPPPPPPPEMALAPSQSAFEPTMARHLVQKYHRQSALEMVARLKAEVVCSKARHDFRFMFLAKDGEVEDLPMDLREIYQELCK